MAQVLPINFAVPGENAIASYDYQDIASGTGFIKYILCSTYQDATTSYKLMETVVRSQESLISGSTMAVALTKLSTTTFDVLFNTPRRIKGKAIACIAGAKYVNAGTGVVSFIVDLIHHTSGGVDTVLDSVTTAGYGTNGTITLEVPLTQIKAGDSLKVEIEVWASNNGAGTTFAGLYFDPLDASTSYYGVSVPYTQSYINIPFVLDL